VDPEFEYRYRAVEARDSRFDGWFFTGVKTTGVFCRPSCPARTPRRENVRFFATALSAREAGFRPCKRCRPDTVPEGPGWDTARDAAARAMELIAQGVVDERGVAGLATELGFSERQLHRVLVRAVGCGPLTLARTVRIKRASLLLETCDLPIAEVAFAAGFTSLRQFNASIREAYGYPPREVRARRDLREPAGPGAVRVRLPYRPPHETAAVIRFLALRAIAGVESARDGDYVRSLRLRHGAGVMRIEVGVGGVHAHFALQDMRDLAAAVAACQDLLDLRSDPRAVVEHLGADPLIGRLVRAAPGRRVPGTVDAGELAMRAVLGQQVTLQAAAKLGALLVCAYGDPLGFADTRVSHLFPSLEQIAAADLRELPMPQARRRALQRLAESLASTALGARRDDVDATLRMLPGIGPWTAGYIAMRALRDPDAFPTGDVGVQRGARRLGFRGTPRELERLAERWRPYRAYAVQHLWARGAREPTVHRAQLAA
jgi:AraC family transcriptional regulator of adaptative response / DNA-3-methyladenine glycosylase II